MKKKLWLIVIIAFLICLYLVLDTLAVFESSATGTYNADIAKFKIKLNDNFISDGLEKTFVIDSFIYSEDNNTESGYISPGRSGYFDVELDANETDVAFMYEITLSPSEELNDNISYSVESLNGGNVSVSDDGVYSGEYSLSDIENNNIITLRINITWTDLEEYDENDTLLGTIRDKKINIPIRVHVSQIIDE